MEFFGSYTDELGLHVRRAGCSYDNLVSDDKAAGEFACDIFCLNLTHEIACKGPDPWLPVFPVLRMIYKNVQSRVPVVYGQTRNRRKRLKHYQLISFNMFTLSSQPPFSQQFQLLAEGLTVQKQQQQNQLYQQERYFQRRTTYFQRFEKYSTSAFRQ